MSITTTPSTPAFDEFLKQHPGMAIYMSIGRARNIMAEIARTPSGDAITELLGELDRAMTDVVAFSSIHPG